MRRTRVPAVTIPADQVTLGYLAGLVDGEGCIRIARTSGDGKSKNPCHYAIVIISNTSLELIGWLSRLVGGSIRARPPRDRIKHKPAYSWEVYGENAETFIRAIEPYLVIKREQARIVLEMRGLGRHIWEGRELDHRVYLQREELKQKIHLLNRRGPA